MLFNFRELNNKDGYGSIICMIILYNNVYCGKYKEEIQSKR
jgi:hypothetical protein